MRTTSHMRPNSAPASSARNCAPRESLLGVAMDGLHAEGRYTNRDVARALGRTVADPLAGTGVHGLTTRHLEASTFEFDQQRTFEHHRVLVELGLLPRLLPTRRALHDRHAELLVAAVHAADQLIDRLRLVPGCLDPSRPGNQGRHANTSPATLAHGDPRCHCSPRTDAPRAYPNAAAARSQCSTIAARKLVTSGPRASTEREALGNTRCLTAPNRSA